MALPKFIALCGNPGAGKSEVQKILQRLFAVQPVDDGWPLRAACMELYGLTRWHVTTQDGKQSKVMIAGKEEEVRILLGDLGKYLEKRHHLDIMAYLAVALVRSNARFDQYPAYSFGSVRRQQAHVYNAQLEGGITIEVRRPGCESSGNDFDTWDAAAVTHVIENDGDLSALESKVVELMAPYQRRGARWVA